MAGLPRLIFCGDGQTVHSKPTFSTAPLQHSAVSVTVVGGLALFLMSTLLFPILRVLLTFVFPKCRLCCSPSNRHTVSRSSCVGRAGGGSFGLVVVQLLLGGVPRVGSRFFFSASVGAASRFCGACCLVGCPSCPSVRSLGSSVRSSVPFPPPSSFGLCGAALPALPLVALGFGFVGAVVAAAFGRACSRCRRRRFGCRSVVLAVRLPPLGAGLTPRPLGCSQTQKCKKCK